MDARAKELYEMKLHDKILIEDPIDHYYVTRVPGGWIYHTIHSIPNSRNEPEDIRMSSVFVPFDNEFQSIPTAAKQGCPFCGNTDLFSFGLRHVKCKLCLKDWTAEI